MTMPSATRDASAEADALVAAAERALRAAAEFHRANGEEWLATQAEARIGSANQSPT